MSPAFDCILPSALASAENLPSLPGAAVTILELSQSPDAGLDDYAKVISTDPALSARILSLANSSLYSLGQDVTSVDQATMVLGTKTVQLMVLSFTLIEQMPNRGTNLTFDYPGYWRRSLTAAVAGRELGRVLGFTLADEAFLCGLLSRIGQLVMAECMSDEYDQVIAEAEGFPTREEEQARLGFNHDDIGAALMKEWGLPEPLYLTVAFAHAPEELPESDYPWTAQLVQISNLASLVVDLLCDGDKGGTLGELHEKANEVGLTSEQAHTIILALESRIGETATLLDIELDSPESHYEILDTARKQLVAISVDTLKEFREIERRSGGSTTTSQSLLSDQNTDELTGLGDRSFLEASLALEVNNRQFSTVPEHMGILLIQIAEFENVLEEYNRSFGDQAISVVGQTLRGMCRASDTPARYGDHTFAILLPSTGPFSLRALAKRITDTIADMPIVAGQECFRVKTAIGGGILSEANSKEDEARLIQLATAALETAKRQGPGSTELKSA